MLTLRTLITSVRWQGFGTTEIAKAAEVSVPRASQVLHQLRAGGFAEKLEEGTWRVDRPTLFDLFMAEYPGPGGDERTYYALDIATAAREITGQSHTDIAFSGDVGADLLSPYRRPSHLIVYTRDVSILEPGVLVSSPEVADANVFAIRPWDTSVFPVRPLTRRLSDLELHLADPTQVAWDLRRLGGSDRLTHLERLKAWILRSP